MPPKVARTGGGSKTQSPKTMAKASSSSKSSGSSKTSSSSSVKKSAPPVTSKPKNVDKVDFGKPKPQADAGVYHKPRMIAAATRRDPEPPKPPKTAEEERKQKIKEAEKKHPFLMETYKYLEKKQEDTKKFAQSPAGHVVGEITLDVMTGGAATIMSAARKIDRFSSETTGEKPLVVKAEEVAATLMYTAARTVVDVGKAILKGGAVVQGTYAKLPPSSSEEGA